MFDLFIYTFSFDKSTSLGSHSIGLSLFAFPVFVLPTIRSLPSSLIVFVSDFVSFVHRFSIRRVPTVAVLGHPKIGLGRTGLEARVHLAKDRRRIVQMMAANLYSVEDYHVVGVHFAAQIGRDHFARGHFVPDRLGAEHYVVVGQIGGDHFVRQHFVADHCVVVVVVVVHFVAQMGRDHFGPGRGHFVPLRFAVVAARMAEIWAVGTKAG